MDAPALTRWQLGITTLPVTALAAAALLAGTALIHVGREGRAFAATAVAVAAAGRVLRVVAARVHHRGGLVGPGP